MRFLYLFPLALLAVFWAVAPIKAEPVLFLSSQLAPLDEASKMRKEILRDFPGEVNFQPYDDRAVFHRLVNSEGNKVPSLIGGLHGDMQLLVKQNLLKDLTGQLPRFNKRDIIGNYLALSRDQTGRQHYIPWMQATYMMAAHRKALEFLPAGADLQRLTYDQLSEWAARINNQTGQPRLGFPAGKGGLMHRFLQGYLYPAYTGAMVRGFKSPQARIMWEDFSALWSNVNPRSLTYNRMDEPLLSGDIWIGWDHTARLLPALNREPENFVAFPAPAGPKGRAYLVVLAGLAIPKQATQPEAALELIDYLLDSRTQNRTLKSVGFFPVVDTGSNQHLPGGIGLAQGAILRQTTASDALPVLLPIGLGEQSGAFNTIYSLAFSQIVLRGRSIESILEKQGNRLRNLLETAGAPCWAPDTPSVGPCPVD